LEDDQASAWETSVKTCERAAEVVMTSSAFGAMYGAVTGTLYGRARLWPLGWLSLFGAGVGFILGAMSGFVTGVIAAAIICVAGVRKGGMLGWTIGGFVPGITLIALTLPSGKVDIVWDVIPTLIGGTLGLATGVAMQDGESSLPGVNWLTRTISAAQSRERP
jgi:hypothetical protein